MKYDLMEVLAHIDPARLSYQGWLNVGMALKEEGYAADTWDAWSRRDPARYHANECAKKWNSFQGAGTPVAGGTIVQYAREQGWEPPREEGCALDWDSVIGGGAIVDTNWLETREVPEARDWHPARELIRYLELLFEAGDTVGYVTSAWWNEEGGRFLPSRGNWDRTAGELIEALSRCGDDIGSVLGDYRPEAGAWIRFNPLDGRGCKNENVTDFRWALVESDTMDIERQFALICELELPARVVVHSGGKSLHAIVHIGAANYEEYRRRVDYLYAVCEKNGLKIDSQNRNPSRLSRMPGAMRAGKRQYIVAENIGKENYEQWREWIEGIQDGLPEPENVEQVWNDLPRLSPPLIEGVLRQGHKMLLAGPSKAGKSFALIELCMAIAEGRRWLGWQCAQGRVLYVNLELDRASCLHRIHDVYAALGVEPANLRNFDVWNLRGKAVPMDKLAPRLIRRAAKRDYIAIVIDPIYKVITGDENSADQMARFCNQFDLVCTELGCAVIYCHHHSKGLQGQKRSMDRASGSGVFARDPDAMLDMIELEVSPALKKAEGDRAALDVCIRALDAAATVADWREYASQDALCSLAQTQLLAQKLLTEADYARLLTAIQAARERSDKRTAWRIEGTLREFERFPPRDLWFDYPAHQMDGVGCLQDVEAAGEQPAWEKASQQRRENAKTRKQEKKTEFERAVEEANFGDPPTKKQLAEYLGVSEKTVENRMKAHGGFFVDKNNGGVIPKKKPENMVSSSSEEET